MGISVYHVDVRKSKNTLYKKSNIQQKTIKDEDKKVYIPQFFEFDIRFFLKENYLICSDKNSGINIYVTPLIRTLLQDLKVNVNKEESLSRILKEKINSSARLLIKKSVENSKEITIHNKQYIKINANFVIMSESCIRIMNDKHYKTTKLI